MVQKFWDNFYTFVTPLSWVQNPLNCQLKCYRSHGSAEESREEERTDEEAGHPPAQVLTKDPSQQAGWYCGESHQTCYNKKHHSNSSRQVWDQRYWPHQTRRSPQSTFQIPSPHFSTVKWNKYIICINVTWTWTYLWVNYAGEPGSSSDGHAECVDGETGKQLLHEAGAFLTLHSWGATGDSATLQSCQWSFPILTEP